MLFPATETLCSCTRLDKVPTGADFPYCVWKARKSGKLGKCMSFYCPKIASSHERPDVHFSLDVSLLAPSFKKKKKKNSLSDSLDNEKD